MRPAQFNEDGSIRGWLEPGEDRATLEGSLRNAPSAILSGEFELKVHQDLYKTVDEAKREQSLTALLQALYQGTIKRYVISLETQNGPRIIKLTESHSWPRRMGALFGISVGRTEHHNQLRAEKMGLTAAHSYGYLELRQGPWLIRSAQVQSKVDPERPILDEFLSEQYKRFGEEALQPLASALAEHHALGFFHADLKGFHAQIVHEGLVPHQPTRYSLRWLDLGRAGFALTERQRVINLYQMVRFVVPSQGQARDTFMRSYCQESGWHRDNPNRAMEIVGRFLDKKLREEAKAAV